MFLHRFYDYTYSSTPKEFLRTPVWKEIPETVSPCPGIF